MRKPKGRSPGYVPEFVFVVSHNGQYLTGCRHAYCPTWALSLTDKCVRWWRRKSDADKLAEKYRVVGAYVGGPKVNGTVEMVEYRRIGQSPQGK